MFIGLFQFVFRLNFCLISHSRLCWVRISVWLYVKYTLSYRIAAPASQSLWSRNFEGSAQNIANLFLNRCFDKLLPNPICVSTLTLLSSKTNSTFSTQCALQIAMNEWMDEWKWGPTFWGYSPISDPPILVPKVFFDKMNSNSCCVPNMKSLASTVTKISRGSKYFWMLP